MRGPSMVWIWRWVWGFLLACAAALTTDHYYQYVTTTSKIASNAHYYPHVSLLECALRCSALFGCWLLLYRPETQTCHVLARDIVSAFDFHHSGSSYRLYVHRPTRQILYFYTEMEYSYAENTCQTYGGRLYLPRSLSDIQMLQDRSIDGFVGLTKFTGVWLDSEGQPFTDSSLWISSFPTNNGDCARVKDGYLVDCSCNKDRKFVCLLVH